MNINKLRIDLKTKAKKVLTECYNVNANAYDDYLPRYWGCLFKDELEIVKAEAKAAKEELKLSSLKDPAMIITLGTSLEPLVLAVHLVGPEQIFPVYTDSKHLKRFKEALKTTNYSVNHAIKPIGIKKNATASTLFKLLRGKERCVDREEDSNLTVLQNILNNEEKRKNIVFDITGAKKTISGGALLFAAYYELPVYYMDFGDKQGDYNTDLGRPYPGSCYYTRQENPIVGFCIKDFERIAAAFDEAQFSAVQTLLGDVLTKMKKDKNAYFEPEEIELYKGLLELSTVYKDWNNGWWGDVYDRMNLLTEEERIYIEHLSKYPKKRDYQPPRFQTELYDDVDGIISYVILELATLLRQKESLHPKNLFLRVYALEEFLIGYMCCHLFKASCLEYEVNNCVDEIDDNDLVKLAITHNFGILEWLLSKGKNNTKIKVPLPYWINIPNRRQYYDKLWVLIKSTKKTVNLWVFKDNRDLRNKAVHGIMAVKPDTAGKVLNALEKLFKTLLNDNYHWFNDTTIAYNARSLINQRNWLDNTQITPIKWKQAEDMIKAAKLAQ